MNKAFFHGRLTKEPRALRTSSGLSCCKFDIAVNSGWGDNAKTSYINITVFGKTADNCIKFLAKGSEVLVESTVSTGSYEKEGRKVYTTDFIAEKIEFIGGKKATEQKQTTIDDLKEVEDDEDMPF